MRNPNLKHLGTFDLVAQTGSFRAAADLAHVTQGAVAQQMRNLEQDLGVSLFERHPKGVRLTEAGARYATEVHQALERIATATAQLKAPENRVTLSVTPSFAACWLMARVARFAEAHPEIELVLLASESLAQIGPNGVDLAIRQGRVAPDPALEVTALGQSALLIVAAPELANAINQPGPADGTPPLLTDALLQRLSGARLIDDTHQHWRQIFETKAMPTPKIGLSVSQTALALEAARAHQGFAVAPDKLVAEDLKSGHLVAVAALSGDPRAAFHVLCRNDDARPVLKTTRDWILAESADQVGESAAIARAPVSRRS